MNSNKPNPTQQFSLLVQTKLNLLEDLLDRGRQQLRLIDLGDSEALLHLLAQKQTSIEDLIRVQAEMDAAGPNGQRELEWESSAVRDRCRRDVAKCNELGKQVLEIEADCERQAAIGRDAIAKQIHEFSAFDSRNCELNEIPDETRLAGFDESS